MTDQELAEIPKWLQAVVVGHVDVGKSTLVGQLFTHFGDTEEVEKKKKLIMKNLLDSKKMGAATGGSKTFDPTKFELRYICDSSATERVKGNTINYHSTGLKIKHGDVERLVNMVDAPGHTDFTKNFIAGSTAADVAVLVVPAQMLALESSLKPQIPSKFKPDALSSDEIRKRFPSVMNHQLRLLNAFGVQTCLVAVNKMGLAPDAYNEANYNEICKIVAKCAKENGFKPSWVNFMPIDVFNKDNLWEKSTNMPWYKGLDFAPDTSRSKFKPAPFHADTLAEYLVKMTIPERNYKEPLKMCVHNVYESKGSGEIYACKVYAGTCKWETPVLHSPPYWLTKIKSIQVHQQDRKLVGVGDEIAITLKSVDKIQTPRKTHVFSDPEHPVPKSRMFIARLSMFGVQNNIADGFEPTVDMQLSHVTVSVDRILAVDEPKVSSRTEVKKLPLTGLEPECLTWNPTITAAQEKAGKLLRARATKEGVKFKPTAEETFLMEKVVNKYHFAPCGNAYLDGITTPLAITCDNRSAVARFKNNLKDPLLITTFQQNTGMGRFCIRCDTNVLGVGMIVQLDCDTPEFIKKNTKSS